MPQAESQLCVRKRIVHLLWLSWSIPFNLPEKELACEQRGSVEHPSLHIPLYSNPLPYPGNRNQRRSSLNLKSSPLVGGGSHRVGTLIQNAQTLLDPVKSPHNYLFLVCVSSKVVQWRCSSKLTCYPGFTWTLKFWWPSIFHNTLVSTQFIITPDCCPCLPSSQFPCEDVQHATSFTGHSFF